MNVPPALLTRLDALLDHAALDALDDAEFDALARATFAWQCEAIDAYGAYARALGRGPGAIGSWRQIPGVFIGAFKEVHLSRVAPGDPCVLFETSGTTLHRPGRVRLSSTGRYEAALRPTFRAFVLPDLAASDVEWVCLLPSADVRPGSSLIHMAETLLADAGATGRRFFLDRDGLALADLLDTMRRATERARPICLLATTIACARLADALSEHALSLSLPAGSRLMDTGGAKGRRDYDRDATHARICARLGLDPALVVGEFGMTELASQRYETTLRARLVGDIAPARAYVGPPWLRTRVLDPTTLEELPRGEVGLLVHHDLACLDTPAAVLTGDLGRAVTVDCADGSTREAIVPVGRAPGAELRGCGLDAEARLR